MPTFAPSDGDDRERAGGHDPDAQAVGPAEVHWRDGLRRMVVQRRPDLFID